MFGLSSARTTCFSFAPPTSVSQRARSLTKTLRPLADQVPPPMLGAAVQRHLQEMERLLGWLRG